MLDDDAFGGSAVAGRDGLEQSGVIVERDLEQLAPRLPHVGELRHLEGHGRADRLHDVAGQFVAGQAGDADVKLGVEREELVAIVESDGLFVEQVAQRGDVGLGVRLGGAAHGPALEHVAELQEVIGREVTEREVQAHQPRQRLTRGRRDDGAAGRAGTGPRLDNAHGVEHAQRFAQRGPADVELITEVALVGQPIAGPQLAGDDQFFKLREHLLERPLLVHRRKQLLVAHGTTLRVVGAMLAALVFAACGSTVRGSAAASRSSDGLSASTAAPTNATTAVTQTSAAVVAAHAGATRTAVTTPGAVASHGGIPTTGKGWDAKYVYVGVTTQKDAQSVYKTAGFDGVNPGDTGAQAQAVADDINRRGGILGRQIKLVLRDLPTLSTATNADSAANSSCTYFAEDHPVVAVVSMLSVLDVPSWRACMAKAHIMLLSAASHPVDDTEAHDLAPYFVQLLGLSWDALAPPFIGVLNQQHYFDGWDPHVGRPSPAAKPKVGILVVDTPGGARQATAIKKALAAAGYTDSLTYAYQFPGNQIQPAILYFNGNGVTHVISTDIELLAFQQNAESQHYRPRYGVNTFNAPQNNLESFAIGGQNGGAVGAGWSPAFDVSAANDPGPSATPGKSACAAIMATGKVQNSGRLAEAFSYAECDGMLLIAQGAAAGGGLAGANIFDGLMRTGATFRPSLTFSSALTAGRSFVPQTIRALAWVDGCSCFKYAAGEARL